MLSKDEIIERLDDVFRDVFDDDTLEVDENTTADDNNRIDFSLFC